MNLFNYLTSDGVRAMTQTKIFSFVRPWERKKRNDFINGKRRKYSSMYGTSRLEEIALMIKDNPLSPSSSLLSLSEKIT